MIVKMKKLYLVTTGKHKTDTLKELRKLGVVHIETTVQEHELLGELTAEKQELVTAYQYLSLYKEKGEGSETRPDEGKAIAREILELVNRKRTKEDEILKLRSEIERVSPWGNFNPLDFRFLADKGILLGLYNMPADKLSVLAKHREYILLSLKKKRAFLILIGKCDEELVDYEFMLPAHSLAELKHTLARTGEEVKALDKQIAGYTVYRPVLKASLLQVEKALEFKRIGIEMPEDSGITYLNGYLPFDQVALVKTAAAKYGWGLAIIEPGDEDAVPTLIRNPGWIRIIKPIFNLLGTTPGYKELDISFWFLLFLGLFFAMIVGDGAYGIIMLAATILVRLKMKKAPPQIFYLLSVMSICTIIWGAVTGTWFGVEYFAHIPFIEKLTLPWLASFPNPDSTVNTTEFIWNLCFLVGAIQLSIARITAFVRKLPQWPAYADLGWLSMLWGNYFLIRTMLLQKPLFPATIWLIGIGFVLFVLFSDVSGSLWKGMLKGLAFAPIKVLSAVSGFADIISYIRLYAVGLASLEVAKAFNSMALAAGFGSIGGGIAASLILLLGHALNIVMSSMSIVVHGVRLNMLEFSGHMGIEWAGNEYKPFME